LPEIYYDAEGDSQYTVYPSETVENGTSYATPIAAAAAGLVFSEDTSLTAAEVRGILAKTADKPWLDSNNPYAYCAYDTCMDCPHGNNYWDEDLYYSWHPEYGYGRINCYEALRYVTWSDTILTDETWSGEVVLHGDIVIPSGVTLTIDTATQVLISPYDVTRSGADTNRVEIKVEGGTLRADAYGASEIAFRPRHLLPSDSASWYSIDVSCSSGKVVFKNVRVANSEYGLKIETETADTIYSCTFFNNSKYGVRCENNSASSSGTIICKNSIYVDSTDTYPAYSYGVRVEGSPVVDSNTIEYYKYGIDASSGDDPKLRYNEIHFAEKGININGLSDPDLSNNAFTGVLKYSIASFNAAPTIAENAICVNDGDSCSYGAVLTATNGTLGCNRFFNCYVFGAHVTVGEPNFGNTKLNKGKDNWFRVPACESGSMYSIYTIEDIDAMQNYWQACDGEDTLTDTLSIQEYLGGTGYVDIKFFRTTEPDCGSAGPGKIAGMLAEAPVTVPKFYSLSQNYPNPFNPFTTIEYSLERECIVTLTVYNVLGRHVATLVDEPQPAGTYQVLWNGKDSEDNSCASGLYLYKLDAGDYTKTKKMMLLK
jgi:hypothetical protein